MRAPSATARRRARRLAGLAPGEAIAGASVRASLDEETVGDESVLVLHFPGTQRSLPQRIPLPALNRFPNLRRPVALALADHGADSPSAATRRTVVGAWRSGLLAFLADEGEFDLRPEDLDPSLISRFVWWLNRPGEDGDAALSPKVRDGYLQTVLLTIDVTRRKRDASGFRGDLRLPRSPWTSELNAMRRGQERFAPPDAIRRTLGACRLQVEETMRTLEPMIQALEERRRDVAVVERALLLGDRVRKVLSEGAVLDLDALMRSTFRRRQRAATRKLLLPEAKDLMPFLVLLAHYTRFNPTVLLQVQLDGVRRLRFGGIDRMVISSHKARGDKPQRAAFAIDASSTNPWTLIEFVRRWTQPMRAMLDSGALFLAAGNNGPMELGRKFTNRSDMLAVAFKGFVERAGLKSYPMTDIRRGWIDLAHLLSAGDPAIVRQIGGQTPDVVDDHYKSPAGGRREAELLAGAMAERERWLASGGKVDARRFPDTTDRSAATPGFVCMDRYNSPMPGQRRTNAPCAKYGKCPICPLAAADTTSPRSCGFLHLLLDRIESSFDVDDAMTAARFLGVWAPIARRLRDFWLPAFDQAVRDRARLLDLPNLPEID